MAIFWQILTKLTTLKGHKILKNQNFRICCIKSLDHISISLQNQNWHFWTSRFLKNCLLKCKKMLFLKKCDFEMFVRMLTVHCDQNNSYEITINGFQVRKINEIRNVIFGLRYGKPSSALRPKLGCSPS